MDTFTLNSTFVEVSGEKVSSGISPSPNVGKHWKHHPKRANGYSKCVERPLAFQFREVANVSQY